jgi:hypothetical protein
MMAVILVTLMASIWAIQRAITMVIKKGYYIRHTEAD